MTQPGNIHQRQFRSIWLPVGRVWECPSKDPSANEWQALRRMQILNWETVWGCSPQSLRAWRFEVDDVIALHVIVCVILIFLRWRGGLILTFNTIYFKAKPKKNS